jgi:hypothetical protein
MVTQLNRAVTARDIGYEWVQYCSARVVADPGGQDVMRLVGKAPAGSVILWINSRVVTTVNGSGSPTIGADSVVTVMNQAMGSENLMPDPALAAPLAVDTEFYASMTGGATSGVAYVTVVFIKPIK